MTTAGDDDVHGLPYWPSDGPPTPRPAVLAIYPTGPMPKFGYVELGTRCTGCGVQQAWALPPDFKTSFIERLSCFACRRTKLVLANVVTK